MNDELCSIRMHASSLGEHLSGGEQLVHFDELQSHAAALLRRALEHERGCADSIQITIDAVSAEDLVEGSLPGVLSHEYVDVAAARHAAVELLSANGVAPTAAEHAVLALAQGAAPGGRVMRGAMLVDAVSGKRLEKDRTRGVRVSRLGVAASQRIELDELLLEAGLEGTRVAEALTLAAKVQHHPDVLAELCWSDDPSYLTGYVATREGYTRLTPLKNPGDSFGGRAFFVRPGSDIEQLVSYLERTPFIITDLGGLAEDLRKF